MSRSVNNVFTAMRNILRRYFTSDLDVMSSEGRRILSNPKDAEAYNSAIKETKKSKKESKFTLENGKELKLRP